MVNEAGTTLRHVFTVPLFQEVIRYVAVDEQCHLTSGNKAIDQFLVLMARR